jgi:hypothetical protein
MGESIARPVESICRAAWLGIKRGDTKVDSANRPNALICLGKANPDAIEVALRLLQTRHSILASRLEEREDAPWIVPSRSLDLEWLRVAHRDGENEQQAAEHAIGAAVWRPLDILSGPLARAYAVRLGDETWFGLVVHHFIADGAAIGVLMTDFRSLYASISGRYRAASIPPTVSYPNYLAGIGSWIDSDHGRTQRAELIARLANMPKLTFGDRQPEIIEERFAFDLKVSNLVRDTAKKLGVTPYTVLLAAQKTLLLRYSSSNDIALKVITAGRELSSLLRTVGNLADRQFVITDLGGDLAFREVVNRTTSSLSAARSFAFVRSDFVLADLARLGLAAGAPVFNFRRIAGGAGPMRPPGRGSVLRVPPYASARTLPRDAYYLDIFDTGRDLAGSIRYGAGGIPGFLSRMEALLVAGCERPDEPISKILQSVERMQDH